MEIIPYSKNAKKHDKKQIEQLFNIIKKVGWRQPAVINQSGVLVVGHGRYETWLQHKNQLKPIWIIDDKGKTISGGPETSPLSPEDEKAYGMELDPKYVDVIVQRYVDYTGDKQIIKNGKSIVW